MNGYVYVQTNDAENNEVVAFGRADDGSLERLGSYLTGGKGSGAPHLPSQSSVVLDGDRLFVTNAGSADVTLFSVEGGTVERIAVTSSGGSAPRSVAVDGDRVWVLNTGEPNIVGLRLEQDGLAPIAGAVRPLPDGSDAAQIAFSAEAGALLVTDRASNSIHVLPVADDGIVADAVTHPSSGMTPYGFDISPDGVLVVTEAAGAQAGKASASSYRVGRASLTPVSGEVGNTRSEVCWALIGRDGRTVFVTNFGDGTISTYAIGDDGSLELLEAVAARTIDGQPGLRDEALSSDGRFLYALHADSGQLFGWGVEADGKLRPKGASNGLPLTAAGLAAS
jgi:6-phosphogluconolactonase (cycloisomerase 2 family)